MDSVILKRKEALKTRVETPCVAIDLETSGKYPLDAEICELAMVKFQGGRVLDQFETLLSIEKKMSPVAESIHGITREKLKSAPKLEEKLPEILEFISGAPLVGHNLSFDLGFLVYEVERFFPERLIELSDVNYCTSLLSLGVLPNLPSHRLVHLSEHYKTETIPDHRALQDAQACLKVFNCLLEEESLAEKTLAEAQGTDLNWKIFSLKERQIDWPWIQNLKEAFTGTTNKSLHNPKQIELKYSKGSKKGQWRTLAPKGLVLKEMDQSFMVCCEEGESQTKRFLLKKIQDLRLKP